MTLFLRHFLLVTLLLVLHGTPAIAKNFAGMNLGLSHDSTALLLDGEMSFNFSKAALEALANGLPLVIETEVNIKPNSHWYWQKSILTSSYKLKIQYHALSQQYLVKGLGNEYQRTYLTQDAALSALGRITEFPLIELAMLDADETYEVSIRAALDSESLPVPLRPLLYLSDEWRMRSDWKQLPWTLKK